MTVCPDPVGCTVVTPAALSAAPRHRVPAGTVWVRCYDSTWGYDEPNPGFGDTRFAPFLDAGGRRVPTMYLADNPAGALLESVFHDTLPGGFIYEDMLRGRLVTFLATPIELVLVDLRDPALAAMGVPRSGVVSSPAEHYPCTRFIAREFHRADAAVHGLIWHSRQAEFHRAAGRPLDDSEVAVVFTARVTTARGGWPRRSLQTVSLGSGEGRTLVDEVADALGVTAVTS